MEKTEPNESFDQDWYWIQKIQEGDSSAFERIFNKYKVSIINLSFRFIRNREIAEEVAQEVFIKVYEKKVHFDPRSKFSTWLYRVTVNASMDFLRKKKFSFRSLEEPLGDQEDSGRTLLDNLSDPKSLSAGESIVQEETKKLVRQGIDRLPENLRSPILLYQFEELPYKEIAKILGITEKAVEKRIYHAKQILREKLSKYL